MRFKLHYEGQLKSKGSRGHKHRIRLEFHNQLADLWKQEPLASHGGDIGDPKLSPYKSVGDWTFSSVVSSAHHLIASLDIVLLWPTEPGTSIVRGGDIDNSLKTLLDALTIPQENQLPRKVDPPASALHCLLEDDRLITGLHVTADRRLGNSEHPLVLIGVDVSCTVATMANLGLVQ